MASGSWHAVDCELRLNMDFDLHGQGNYDWFPAQPAWPLSIRNGDTFLALTGYDSDRPDAVAVDGLTPDASAFARGHLLEDETYFGQSHADLGRLRSAARDAPADLLSTEDEVRALRSWVRLVEDRYLPSLPEVSRILVGRHKDPETGYVLPDQRLLSAHRQLLLRREAHELLPIGDATLRFLFAFSS